MLIEDAGPCSGSAPCGSRVSPREFSLQRSGVLQTPRAVGTDASLTSTRSPPAGEFCSVAGMPPSLPTKGHTPRAVREHRSFGHLRPHLLTGGLRATLLRHRHCQRQELRPLALPAAPSRTSGKEQTGVRWTIPAAALAAASGSLPLGEDHASCRRDRRAASSQARSFVEREAFPDLEVAEVAIVARRRSAAGSKCTAAHSSRCLPRRPGQQANSPRAELQHLQAWAGGAVLASPAGAATNAASSDSGRGERHMTRSSGLDSSERSSTGALCVSAPTDRYCTPGRA